MPCEGLVAGEVDMDNGRVGGEAVRARMCAFVCGDE